jgi:hypothetical protein
MPRMQRAQLVPGLLLFSLVISAAEGAGCASGGAGGSGRDAGSGGLDARVEDGGSTAREDAGSTEDASLTDGGALTDGGSDDGGASGPRRCTPADAPAVCGGRPCVDGYCCDGPCTGACRSCNRPGVEGTCTLHAAGTDPDSECPEQPAASCGTSGVCDGAGACAFHPDTVSCDDGQPCTTGDRCDGVGTCRGASPADCAPGPGNECCLGSCGDLGCSTAAGACADVCGGAQLVTGRSCGGCGTARAAGTCVGGTILRCDAGSHTPCQQASCGGATYFCTNAGGTWAWRTGSGCDDGNACTTGDACVAGACAGAARDCSALSTGCTMGVCDPSTGACGSTPIGAGSACDDGNACTFGETCGAGRCGGGTTVTCPPSTTCLGYVCNGTASCVATPRNLGGPCDDGDPATSSDVCLADGTCRGSTCPPTPVVVFSEDFATPSTTSFTSGTDQVVSGTSRWRGWTSAQHGVRITAGRMEITNQRGSTSPGHGHGYAVVRSAGATSVFDSRYRPALKQNTDQRVVWSFNLRRDDPERTAGGFSCSSTSRQNYDTIGLAYVLATDSSFGLNASTSTCSASATGFGYAVVMGGDRRIRLVRFQNGLRNGTLTTIVQTSGTYTVSNHFSVRVSYDATNDQWRLEARSDGSSFSDPASGTYGFSGTGVDATYVNDALEYSGPYFQTGCSGVCTSSMQARFDNVRVTLGCAM